MNKDYYVYFHIRLSNNQIFYIGKGKNKRYKSVADRNKHWHNVANKGYYCLIYANNLTEKEAFNLEKEMIKKYKSQLVNLTDGGEGTSGYKYTKEQKKNCSDRYFRMMKKGFLPRLDKTIYNFLNMNGDSFEGTIKDFKEYSKLSQSVISHIIRKIDYLTIDGWYHEKADLKKCGVPNGDRHSLSDKNIYSFIHDNGTIEHLKRFEFCKKYNICNKRIYELVSNNTTVFGWRLLGTKRKSKKECKLGSKNPMHNIKGKDNSKSNKSIITVYKDDDIFIGTWYEFADKFQVNRKFASEFFSGRKNSCYGWIRKEN